MNQAFTLPQLKEIEHAIQMRDKAALDKLLPEKLIDSHVGYFDQSALSEDARPFVDVIIDDLSKTESANKLYSATPAERLAILKTLEAKTDCYLEKNKGNKRSEQEAAASYATLAQNLFNFNPDKALVDYAFHLAKKADIIFQRHNLPEYSNVLHWDEKNLADKYQNRTPYEKRIKLYKESGAQAQLFLDKARMLQDTHKIERLKDLNYFGEHFWCKMFIHEYENGQKLPFENPTLDKVLHQYSYLRMQIDEYEGRVSLLERGNLSAIQAPYQGKKLFDGKLIGDTRYDDVRLNGIKEIFGVLDHIEAKAKGTPFLHLVMLVQKAEYVESLLARRRSYPISKKEHTDFLKTTIEHILTHYSALPDAIKKSPYGILAREAIAAASASFHAMEATESVSKKDLSSLYTKTLSVVNYSNGEPLHKLGGIKRLLVNLGKISFEQGKYHDAIAHIERAISADTDALFLGADWGSTKSAKTPYQLLEAAYRKTGQEAKTIPLLEKQQSLVLRDLAKLHMFNKQLDVKELLAAYYKNYPEYGVSILDKAGFTEKTNWHERTLSHKKHYDNDHVISYVSELIDINHNMVRAYANSGQPEKAKELFNQLSATTDAIEKLSQSHKVDFAKSKRSSLHELVGKKIEAAQFLADNGIENDVLVKLKAGDPKKQETLLDTLLASTYLEKKFASPDRIATIKTYFEKLCKNPNTAPLMEIAKRGVKGEYGLSEPLRIFIENKPHASIAGCTEFIGNNVHIYMQFGTIHHNNENLLYNFNTISHELTHYITNILYDNLASPYSKDKKEWTEATHSHFTNSIKNDRNMMNEYLAQRDRIEHQHDHIVSGKRGIEHLKIWNDFSISGYPNSQVDSEYIARFFGELARESYQVGDKAGWEVISEALPEFSAYVKNVFLKDVDSFLKHHDKKHPTPTEKPAISAPWAEKIEARLQAPEKGRSNVGL